MFIRNVKSFFICAAMGVLGNQAFAGNLYEFDTTGYSASADFELSGTSLTILVKNREDLGTTKAVPTDFLTGVAFNSLAAMTPVSVALPSGTTTWFGSTTNAGTGWGYGFGGSYHGQNNVISASGAFSGVGHSSFPSPATPGTAVGGLDYAIATANFTGNANSGAKHGPVFSNSLLFTFTVDKAFSLDQLGKSIVFQYGTDVKEPSFTATLTDPVDPSTVPEPSTLALGALGSLGLAFMTYRRRRNNAV
jgi:hypothetical protein